MEYNNTKYIENTDEITLRELIQVVLDYKLLIATITVVVVLLTAIYTYGIQENEYTAKATLSVKSATRMTESLSSIDDIIDYMNEYPIMTVESYVEQILTPQVLYETIRELDLRDGEDEYISVTRLTNKVEVANVKDTNLITIRTTDNDPELAAMITNVISERFIAYTNDRSKEQSQAAAVEIEKQLILEEVNVEEKSQAIAEYLASNVSIEELSQEVSSLISQVTSIKSSINSLEVKIGRDEQAIKELLSNADISVTSLTNVELNLSNGELSNSLDIVFAESNELQKVLLTMEITETETSLINNRSEKEASEAKLIDMQEQLMELQTTLAEQEYKYNSLNRDLELAKQTYNAYQSRHKEAIVAAASNIGNNSVYVSSKALVPSQAVGDTKIIYILSGLIIGLAGGVFIAFLKDYWEKTK